MPDYSFKVKLSDVSASQLSSNIPRSPEALPFYRLDFNGKIVQSDVATQPGDPSWKHKCSFEYRLQEESFEACLQSLAGRWATISVLFLEPNTGHETPIGSCSVDLLTLACGASRCVYDLKNRPNDMLNLPYSQPSGQQSDLGGGAICGKVEFSLIMEQQTAVTIELQNISISPMPSVAPYKLAYTLQSMKGAHEVESNVVSATTDPVWDAQLLPKLVSRCTLRDFLADSLMVLIKDVSHKGSPAIGRFEVLMSDIIQTHISHTVQFRRNAYAVADISSNREGQQSRQQQQQQQQSTNGLVHSFNNNSTQHHNGGKPSAMITSSWGALVTGTIVFRDLPQLAQMNPESASNINGMVHGKPLLPSCMVPASHSKYPSAIANLSRASNRTFVQNGGIPVAATQFHNNLYGPPMNSNLTTAAGNGGAPYTSTAPAAGQVGYFPTSPVKVPEYGGAAGGTNMPYTADGTAPMTADTVRMQLQHMEDRKAKFNIAPPQVKPVTVHHHHHYGNSRSNINTSMTEQSTINNQPQLQSQSSYPQQSRPGVSSPNRTAAAPTSPHQHFDASNVNPSISYSQVDPLFRVHSRRGSMVGSATPAVLNATNNQSNAFVSPPQNRFESPSRVNTSKPLPQAQSSIVQPIVEHRHLSPPRADHSEHTAAATVTAAARASLQNNPITATGQALVDQYREAVSNIEAQMTRVAAMEQKINDETAREETLLHTALKQLQREEDTFQLDLEKCGRMIKEIQRAEEDFVAVEHKARLEVEVRENAILNELDDLSRVERELLELMERVQVNILEDEKGRERARAERESARLRLDVTSREFNDLSHKVHRTVSVRSPVRVQSPPNVRSAHTIVPKHVSPPRVQSSIGASINSRAISSSYHLPPVSSQSQSLALKHQEPIVVSPPRSPYRNNSALSVHHHSRGNNNNLRTDIEPKVISPPRQGGRNRSIAASLMTSSGASSSHFDASANLDRTASLATNQGNSFATTFSASNRLNESRALSPVRDHSFSTNNDALPPAASLEPVVVPYRKSGSGQTNMNSTASVNNRQNQLSSIAASSSAAPSMDVTLALDLKDITKAIETSNVALFRSIIAQNPDVLYASNSLLHAACASNSPCYEIVAAIVAIRPELVYAVDKVTGNVPLHFLCAAKEPSIKVADCLISASGGSGSNSYSGMVTTINNDGLTPFHVALLNVNDYQLPRTENGSKSNDSKDSLKSFLLRRCGKEMLLAKTAKGESAAHLCAINDKYLPSLKFLFTNGAPCDQTAIVLGASNAGLAVTPLEKARMYGSASTEIQRYLQHVVGY